MKPRLLDAFCCEGGAAAGYVAAGFEVHGVDIVHPEDPAERERRAPSMRDRYLASGASSFTVADASTFPFDGFDAVHASPPCEDHSTTMQFGLTDRGTGWLLPHTIARLRASSLPFVIENVESRAVRAHMPDAVRLCGSMFGLGANDSHGNRRILRRHRLFLTSFPMLVPPCTCRGQRVGGVYGHGEQGVNGGRGYGFAADRAREAMGMPWASRDGCAEAIPPAYTQFLGERLMSAVMSRRAVAA